ncbi:MAG: nucleotidyl transferase AbiEii/AbiGii toxin family protein [bacterium]
MIPLAFITEWEQMAPWRDPIMVEQDLIISRALLDLFRQDTLRQQLAFRGGTALYKLFLVPAARYSEDIDLVQITAGPIKETVRMIQEVLDHWLGQPRYKATQQSVKLIYRYAPETAPDSPARLKIEINTREHVEQSVLIAKDFSVDSRWVQGSTSITSFALEELLGTKLRALYQRKKGRDLFDLDYALTQVTLKETDIVDACVAYMAAQGNRVSTREFQLNLFAKQNDREFREDTVSLLRDGIIFDIDKAVERVDQRLLQYLDVAWIKSSPPHQENP